MARTLRSLMPDTWRTASEICDQLGEYESLAKRRQNELEKSKALTLRRELVCCDEAAYRVITFEGDIRRRGHRQDYDRVCPTHGRKTLMTRTEMVEADGRYVLQWHGRVVRDETGDE